MDYIDLFQSHIKKIKGNGVQFTGLCPFHEDTHQSFSGNFETGLWTCHAGCGSGNAYQFAKAIGIDPEPYKNGTNPLKVNVSNKGRNGHLQGNNASELSQDDKNRAMTYHKYLLEHFEELTKGLPWTIEAVKKTYTGYDPEKQRFTFIHTNAKGKAVNIKWHKGAKGDQPFSIPGHGQCRLFPLHLLKEYNPELPLIFAEGEKDVITLLSQGFQAVTSTTGAESFPDLLPLSEFKNIIIVFDNDQAGEIGGTKLAGAIKANLPYTKIHIHKWNQKPPKYDITDFFNEGGTAASFQKLIEPDFRDFPVFQGARIDWRRLTAATAAYLDLIRDTTDAPDEFLLTSLLGFWAGVVGNKIILEKPENLYPNLWLIMFGKSSEIRKSTALRVAGKPFYNIQSKFDKGFSEELSRYDGELREWEALSKNEKAKNPKPEPPSLVRIIIGSDFSEAGFFQMLENNPVAGTIVTAEFSDFHRKLHRDYTNMSDAFLSAYDNDRMTRNTIKRGTEIIAKPTFSILGATTIKNFTRVFSATETENGFLQRIMPVFIAEPTKKRKGYLKRTKPDPDMVNDFEKMSMNWFRYDGLVEVVLNDDIVESFDKWEDGFIAKSKETHGKEISPHLERMVPVCLKLSMLLESLQYETPPEKLIISKEALNCAQMIVEDLFLPSLVYLLENEIIFDRNLYDEKRIERAIREAGGFINRSELMRTTRISKKRMDELTETMIEKGKIQVTEDYQSRSQGGGNAKKVYQWVEK